MVNGAEQGAGGAAGLVVDEVSVVYPSGLRAVDRVSLDVAPGEVLALVGASGSGKSSLLRAIAGLEPLAEGGVRIGGADLAGVPVHRRGVGLVFQDGQLFDHLDVGGNIAYGLRSIPAARRPDRAARAARVAELLELVGLADLADRPVTTLSGGQAQRVALARALAPRPRVLLLDEPLSALDRALRERLAVDLAAILRAAGTTAVHVTHDLDEASTVADRVAVLSGGRLRQVATPAELWHAPADREVAELLGHGPVLAAERLGLGAGEVALAPGALVLLGRGESGPGRDDGDAGDGAGRTAGGVGGNPGDGVGGQADHQAGAGAGGGVDEGAGRSGDSTRGPDEEVVAHLPVRVRGVRHVRGRTWADVELTDLAPTDGEPARALVPRGSVPPTSMEDRATSAGDPSSPVPEVRGRVAVLRSGVVRVGEAPAG